jgi:hypothetical protein
MLSKIPGSLPLNPDPYKSAHVYEASEKCPTYVYAPGNATKGPGFPFPPPVTWS